MYGTRQEFKYTECARCGCVQLDKAPEDLSEFYPEQYYSLSISSESQALATESNIKRSIRSARDRYLLGQRSIIGALATRVLGQPRYFSWMKDAAANQSSRILDVGSGVGSLVFRMTNAGFSNVSGIDPYIVEDIQFANGAVVNKSTLESVKGPFDLVMLHHSFEHMPDPHEQLVHIRRILSSNGVVLIRMPVAGTYAWNTYGVDWVQLDAPRHLVLHTEKSMAILAANAGFSVSLVKFDSTDFQFWGSELYANDVALFEGIDSSNPKPPITRKQFHQYRKQAAQLNASGQGDQAEFYLRINDQLPGQSDFSGV